jgi:TetR/AcrR family tetracycline transcriptional repressor
MKNTKKAPQDRPQISRDRVLEAALTLVDREGLAELSMRKLGAELGIEAMSVYHYFPNKDAVLDGLVEGAVFRTLSSQSVLDAPSMLWTDRLRALARSLRHEMLQHPKMMSLIATRPVMTQQSLHAAESIAAALCQSGFTPQQAFQLINIVTTFVVGHSLAEAGDTPGHEDAKPDIDGIYDRLDPAEFPCFREAIRSGLGQPEDHQQRFDLALNALCSGLAIIFAMPRVNPDSDQ